MTRTGRLLVRLAGLASAAALLTSCAWKPYVAARAVQAVAGAPIRMHIITPLDANLRHYRVIEIALESLVPREIGGRVERDLGRGLTDQLRRLATSPAVALRTEPETATGSSAVPSVLVLEGIIDDYETGSAVLRAADVGFNHAAVTVRFQLRDKQSGRVLGAASITAQDGRPGGGAGAAMKALIHRLGAFVDQGYKRR